MGSIDAMVIELIGYIASFMVILSLTMKNMMALRFINTAAAFWFCVYGILISSYPVIITNVLIICINVYHIYNEFTKDKE
jgi:hypothetical protein